MHAAPGAAAPRPGFRPDIQGLRAIAVLLVLLYHSGVSLLSGGFVGVDVFFVLSGFLITTHLLEALERDGRIRFGAFYAKRARRILPAALVAALLSVFAAWIWMSPLLLPEVLRGAAATALYVPNYLFAQQGTNYLAEATSSVFQHYWSLGIEEQFYLLWPLLLMAGFWLGRRSERRLMWGAAALTAASFLFCVALMDVSQPWTFFSLPTRAWELGAGALVAFTLRSGARWLRSPRTGQLAWAGLAGLALVVLTFDEATAFPGAAAALPVLATAALLIGGAAPGGLHAGRLLGLPPLQFLGAISYSLYLVHWPLQVIPQAASLTEEPLPLSTRLLLGAAAVPLAWLLHRLVEQPVLRRPSLRRSPAWVTGAIAAAASLAVIITATGISWALPQQTSSDRVDAAEQPSLSPTGTGFVPANLSPTLKTVSGDNPSVYAAGCHQEGEAADANGCQAGENPDAPLVFLVGDSHAANWYPALERLAEEGRIRLDSSTKSSCLPLETPQQDQVSRSGEEKLVLRPGRLSEIAENSVESFALRAEEAGIALISDLQPPAEMPVDTARMQQAVDNLLSNAVKYTRRGGTVTVATEMIEGHAELRVTDTGIGMTAQEQTNLFTDFYRTETARNSDIPGHGIGLSLTRRIVVSHNGQISVRSQPGEGSTFRIRFAVE
nr:acyltransferase family protein [Brachybacterium muris]